MKSTKLGDMELFYADCGQGTPVVLVHAFPLDHTVWDAQVEALSVACWRIKETRWASAVRDSRVVASGGPFRAIAPDLRGFGRSGLGGTGGWPVLSCVSIEQYADDLAALLDALAIDQPVVLAGVSMGGYVALEFWRRHRSRLRAIVLCDTRATADSPEAAALREQTAARLVDEGTAFLEAAMLPRLLGPAAAGEQPRLLDRVRRTIAANNPRGLAAASLAMARRTDFTPLLPAIDCPTLLIVGREDVVSPPAEMAAMAAAIPGARLVEIPGAGHLSPMERPDEVSAAILAFLATIAPCA